jgi:hypothetical protein
VVSPDGDLLYRRRGGVEASLSTPRFEEFIEAEVVG